MKRNKAVLNAKPEPPAPPVFSTVWKWTGVGVFLAVSGFAVLTQSDASGRDWASHLAPVLILSGYTMIAVSLWKNGK